MELLAHVDHATKRTQSLLAHSQGTAALCAEFGREIGAGSLGRLVGLAHDSGKGTARFQSYLRTGDTSQRGQIPHAFCGTRFFYEIGAMDGSIRGLTAELAAAAISAHHSGLPDVTGLEADDALKRRAWPEKPVSYEEAARSFGELIPLEKRMALFEPAQQEVGGLCRKIREVCGRMPAGSRKKAVYFMLGLLQRYLTSCLIDADRYDTFLFEADKAPEPERTSPDFWQEIAGRLEESLRAFPAKTPIDRERHRISDQCLEFSRHTRGIFRLSVPTGSGKTMASLRYALNCAKEGGKRRIFYIAPYKSILEQNAADIRSALNLADESIILEHHTDVVIDDREDADAARHSLLTQRWDSPMILTTAVQFLNTLFDGRTACVRRMHSLANSVIVLDEVQALPTRCTSMVNAALDFLAYVCNCAVVLCTATQPETERLALPVVDGEPAQMTRDLEATFSAFRRTRAVDKTAEGPLSVEQLADFALERLGVCENVLMILNTKSAAKSLYLELKKRMAERAPEDRVPVCCLSTSLCPQHRMDRIAQIRAALSDPSGEKSRLICVSTQLIEAGVNLSFQCVIRSLAGLDSIAQAAGRCNRHGESPCRDVFIVRCAGENLSRLPDIRNAQEAAAHVLQDYRSNPGQFAGDPLSPQAVKRYYHYYFEIQRPLLNYLVCEKDDPRLFTATDLFDLLSVNTPACRFCAEHRVAMPSHPMHQAYETAGRIFEAIDSGGLNVIVPYGQGEEIIQQLSSDSGLAELPKLLRLAQRYSVHLFDWEKIRLNEAGAIDLLPESGVCLLRDEFYSRELGVRMEPGEMETLIL